MVALTVAACDRPVDEPAASAAESEDQEALEELSALAYLSHVPREKGQEKRGVVYLDRQRTAPGVTAFGNRRGEPRAYFFDRDGRELDTLAPHPTHGDSLLWMETTADGQLLASGRGYLMKIKWDGETVWEAPRMPWHHGFAQTADGTIYGMASQVETIETEGRAVSIVDDWLVELSPAGELRRTISMLELLGKGVVSPPLLERLAGSVEASERSRAARELAVDHLGDVFHLNSVAVLGRDMGDARRGDLVLSLRSLNLVLAIDPRTLAIRWRWDRGRGLLDRQHFPWPLDNGNLLVFDNGWLRGYSRLIELDPQRDQIVWTFRARKRQSFYTRRGGMAQPLPTGNVLVTDSDSGRLFEITRDGDVVWDFWNPIFSRSKEGASPRRQTIYRAWRWHASDLAAPAVPAALRAATR